MSYKFEQGKDAIIDAVVQKITKKLKGKQCQMCAEFAQKFYGTVALDDLADWNVDDLYGAVINYWKFISQRGPNETKIRIYNPEYERHGWSTTHTVIEIIHDDMPFLIDSVRMEINRMGLTSHLIIHMGGLKVNRDNKGQITALSSNDKTFAKTQLTEAPILIEIDRQTDPKVLDGLHRNFERILKDTRAVVADWEVMRAKIRQATDRLDTLSDFVDENELNESKDFLRWVEDHHFTFLGVRDYRLVRKGRETLLQLIPDTGYGVLRDNSSSKMTRNLNELTLEARELMLSAQILVIAKTNTQSSVHRPIYTDYIGIKQFDDNGEVIGERRIIGLYTSAAYNTNPKHIPFLRRKVTQVMDMSHLSLKSHAGKVLLNILETLPRDDLFQASPESLLELSMGIFHMQERRRIRMFARKDIYGRFVSCLVYVPKERFNTELRREMEKVLCKYLNAIEISFSTRFSDSVLARIHFMIKLNKDHSVDCDFKEVEKVLIEVGRSWNDDLKTSLLDAYGEEKANELISVYSNAFSNGYKESFSSRMAVSDIKHVEQLTDDCPLGMNFYRPVDDMSGSIRFKVFQHNNTIPLSDVLPILENLGLRVLSERPYVLKLPEDRQVWINDFGMLYANNKNLNVDEMRDGFQQAFESIWVGRANNDGFNQLVLGGGLTWCQVVILRAYAKYFRQIRFTFSQDYIEAALNNNTSIARQLVALFEVRLNPHKDSKREQRSQQLQAELLAAMDQVINLDEDKILRHYVAAIVATLRTNYFQRDEKGRMKSYLSLKLNTAAIPDVPQPCPMFEIFVYSPRVEGVHLRKGKVARGGLRWSDRREDFRTEVLGLMKAQQVKNAVIVPSGAKGGFVPMHLPLNGTREEYMAEGINCYMLFIRGLLDITDNYKQNAIVKPVDVYCYDEDDPYLVVAADKGTATFSDIANGLSKDYDFWLGDAFASGGSAGYDHKKMGITARGAWESVKRHFREMGRDIQRSDFSVIGIGDMAGDVFGNGMLLSEHTQLLGAFNHIHIFLDPNPDTKKSFSERRRLFDMPRSTWLDYDAKQISKGGGVFLRSAKSIKLSPEVKRLFGLKQDKIVPNDLIQVMLKSEVDLLWSGGIGTFVKGTSESDNDAGDRSNDAIRINASDLRCKVVGEGANLGLTQLARVEYALNGGMIFTDFIDNSAGVDCSDNEVNIKILLNDVVANGDMTEKQRNQLLAKMTDEVAHLVLHDNYQQTQAISLAAAQSSRNIELHGRYINALEKLGKIDRGLEFLPDDTSLMERKLLGKGLTRPGIAVLLCYSKTILNEEILQSDVPEDPYLIEILHHAFPKPLQKKYSQEMQQHQLRREIIATKLSNIIINEMGFTFIYRLRDETGAPISAIVRAYMITRSIFDLSRLWEQIQALDNIVPSSKQVEMMMQYIRLLRRATRWFLRSQRMRLDIASSVDEYGPGIKKLKQAVPGILGQEHREKYQHFLTYYTDMGVSEDLAHELAITRPLFSALDIIEAAHQLTVSIEKVAELYFLIGGYLDVTWIRMQVIAHPTENHWESLSREALRDDLDWQQRQLTVGILRSEASDHKASPEQLLAKWKERYQLLIERWQLMLADLRASNAMNYTMFFVAIRELLDLTQTTVQSTEIVACEGGGKPVKRGEVKA